MCRFTITERNFRFLRWTYIAVLTLFATNIYSQCEISCKASINVSIGEDCQGVITPSMILSKQIMGATVEVTDANGNIVPNNTVDLSHVGKTLTVKATEPNCSNSCWGVALIEDKIPPIIDCFDVTVTCAELIVFQDPIPVSCDVSSLVVLNKSNVDISCESELFQQVITQTYQASDLQGNKSEPCTQKITVEKFDLGLIDFNINNDTTLYCDGGYEVDFAGNPKFDILGGPTLSGQQLYPDQFIICNTYIEYKDQVLAFNNCVTNVLRTWKISNWFCGRDNFREFTQLYTIVDTVGPVFLTCPSDVTVSTSGNSCEATYQLPLLELSDACNNAIVRVDVNYTGGFLSNGNGATIQLSAGVNSVEYISYDECGNSNSCRYEVLVRDLAQPVTICDRNTVVSLSSDGYAFLYAKDLDDGSFDECGEVTLEIRRMDAVLCDLNDLNFGNEVQFCCDDIGTNHMVALRVTDASLNTNTCMASVEVQDKLPPVILANLPNITVSCTFPFDPENLNVFGKVATHPDDQEDIIITSETVKFSGPNRDGLVIDNCSSVASDAITYEQINQCGIGYIVRTIVTSNPQGQSVTMSQTIYFANNAPFIEENIDWPDDYNPTTSCRPEDLEPSDLPDGYNFPVFTEDGCDMVGVTYEDKIVTNTPNGGGCYKIIRSWYVSDWCQTINGKFPVWKHDQYIEVFNNIAPTIDSGCENQLVCVYDADCGPGFIELEVNGSDDCVIAANLIWKYEIDLHSNGGAPDLVGKTNKISGNFEVGIHTVTWTLSDGCSNFDVCTQQFEIRNCKTPTPYCINGLSADLTAMDLNNDGEIDAEMLMLTPDMLDVGSSHTCGYDVLLSFSSDVNDTLRIFNCEDLGQQEIEVWVTDVVNYNQDFCRTYIIIQDNNDYDFCEPGLNAFDVEGKISTEQNQGIVDVSIQLEGTDYEVVSDSEGKYHFDHLAQGMSFSIVPGYNENPINGVSTLDLILIQKHILGLETMNNPYKLIAADINNSGEITASDLIVLRKMILGKYDSFPENKSWKFLDANFQFLQPSNPWTSSLPEKYDVAKLGANMDVNFTGIKIGDVNGSVQMSKDENVITRSNVGLDLYANNVILKAGAVKEVEILASENGVYSGYQFALKFNPNLVDIVAVNGQSITNDIDNVGSKWIQQGIIKTNFFDSNNFELNKDQQVISVSLVAKQDVELANIISIDHSMMVAESYNTELEEKGVEIEIRTLENTFGENILFQNSPNPWSNATEIQFNLAKAQNANVKIYSITGKLVANYSNYYNKGINKLKLTNSDIPNNGVYYYELATEDFRAIKKMIVTK